MGEVGHRGHLKDPAVAGKNKRQTSRPGRGTITSPYGVTNQIVFLLGARTAVAESMELLFWERKFEGLYGKEKRTKAYTRTLIGKIALKIPVGYMGKEIRVAVCHLHFQACNKKHTLPPK